MKILLNIEPAHHQLNTAIVFSLSSLKYMVNGFTSSTLSRESGYIGMYYNICIEIFLCELYVLVVEIVFSELGVVSRRGYC